MPFRTRVYWLSRAEELPLLGVGEELAVEGVGDTALEAAQRFERGLPGGLLAPEVSPARSVEADLADRAMWIMWFILRFPARESR